MYDGYIYASYGVTFLALAALAFFSLRGLMRARGRSKSVEDTQQNDGAHE